MTTTLLVSVDTEEEFDWAAPVSPKNRSVSHVAHLPRLQELFESLGVRPTYLVDHPIATTNKSVRVLAEFLRRGACEIGAHVHPWVNPPIVEKICPKNSYLSNLPLSLQQEKLAGLTGAIEQAFGVRPTSFKAGRYGLDFALVPSLQQLGYTVDTSIIAFTSFAEDGGPCFERFGPEPFWLVPATDRWALLEIPCTVGFSRRPFRCWAAAHRRLSRPACRPLHLVGVLWHLRLLRKIVLSPELSAIRELLTLLRLMAENPGAVLNLSLHSPSVAPGNTPFVRTEEDLERFFAALRSALECAVRELGARCLTLSEYQTSFAQETVR